MTVPHSRAVAIRDSTNRYLREVCRILREIDRDIDSRGFPKLWPHLRLPEVYQAYQIVLDDVLECDSGIAERDLARAKSSGQRPASNPFDASLANALCAHVDEQIALLPTWIRNYAPHLHIDKVDFSPLLTRLKGDAATRIRDEYAARADGFNRDVDAILPSEHKNTASSSGGGANRSKFFPHGIPDNPDLFDLVLKLDTERDTGKSMNQIAREFTGETIGNDRKAMNILSHIRKLRKEGRINL